MSCHDYEHKCFGALSLVPRLPRLFGLALNSGLEPYRAEFLRAVGSSVDPNATWGYFVSKLAQFENSPKQPRDVSSIVYPVDFEAAAKLYGPDL